MFARVVPTSSLNSLGGRPAALARHEKAKDVKRIFVEANGPKHRFEELPQAHNADSDQPHHDRLWHGQFRQSLDHRQSAAIDRREPFDAPYVA
jgi:hypothetical protein